MTITRLSEAVAAALGLQTESVSWIAHKLRQADLLPVAACNVTSLHLARLALAVAGTQRPIDASPLIDALERTPASEMVLRPSVDSAEVLRVDAAAVPQTPAEHEIWPMITRSIVHAAALIIEVYSFNDTDDGSGVRGMKIRRDVSRPFATLELGDMPNHTNPTRIITYGTDTPTPDDGLYVFAAIDGQALVKLGRALGQWRGRPIKAGEPAVYEVGT